MILKNKLLRIINHYGIEHQQRKLQEEVFELQESITLAEWTYPKEIAKEKMEEEMADVVVMLMQFANFYKLNVVNIRHNAEWKIERQIERINVECMNCGREEDQ